MKSQRNLISFLLYRQGPCPLYHLKSIFPIFSFKTFLPYSFILPRWTLSSLCVRFTGSCRIKDRKITSGLYSLCWCPSLTCSTHRPHNPSHLMWLFLRLYTFSEIDDIQPRSIEPKPKNGGSLHPFGSYGPRVKSLDLVPRVSGETSGAPGPILTPGVPNSREPGSYSRCEWKTWTPCQTKWLSCT